MKTSPINRSANVTWIRRTVDEALIEWLYQVSLGKKACDKEMEAAIDAVKAPALMDAAAHALILSEYRQELANAESNGDVQLATNVKRRIDLVEGEMLELFESVKA